MEPVDSNETIQAVVEGTSVRTGLASLCPTEAGTPPTEAPTPRGRANMRHIVNREFPEPCCQSERPSEPGFNVRLIQRRAEGALGPQRPIGRTRSLRGRNSVSR